ncbi:MAG TPA: AAA family ATPase, partial [Saprospiraceae bacterium]|nr:AAA family ATPase [Saprospiraceae bacterium]
YLHQDKGSSGRPRPAADLESTLLSSVTNTDFPHALAVRQEMENWHFLQLNPVELRKPAAKFTAREFMAADGSGLAGALFRIKASDPMNLQNISREMANLIPGIASIDVVEDEIEKKYVIKAKMDDGRMFSSQVLSEGTLRLLALCTLKHDEQHRGVLCFEEPENGVNPMGLPKVLTLLHGLTTDFARDQEATFPARQVLINTHSPGLVAEVYKMKGVEQFGSIFFARLVTHISKGRKTQHTRLQQVDLEEALQTKMNFDPNLRQVERSVGKAELLNYLESVRFEFEPNTLNEP